jgi:hypothetical protein
MFYRDAEAGIVVFDLTDFTDLVETFHPINRECRLAEGMSRRHPG